MRTLRTILREKRIGTAAKIYYYGAGRARGTISVIDGATIFDRKAMTEIAPKRASPWRQIPAGIWALGFVSLLMGHAASIFFFRCDRDHRGLEAPLPKLNHGGQTAGAENNRTYHARHTAR